MIKYEDNFKYTGLTDNIIGEAYKVHNKLGFGFLEKVYENVLITFIKNLRLKNDHEEV